MWFSKKKNTNVQFLQLWTDNFLIGLVLQGWLCCLWRKIETPLLSDILTSWLLITWVNKEFITAYEVPNNNLYFYSDGAICLTPTLTVWQLPCLDNAANMILVTFHLSMWKKKTIFNKKEENTYMNTRKKCKWRRVNNRHN